MSRQAFSSAKRFDVDDLRRESGGVYRGLALLDVFGTCRNQQHIVGLGIFLGGSQHFEVIADFVHGERNVLVSLHLDLRFEIALAQAARHLDDLGDRGVAGNCDGNFLGARAGTFDGTTNRLANSFRVDDRFFVHCILRCRLRRVRFDAIGATAHHELDQLDRRSRYVKPEQRTILAS